MTHDSPGPVFPKPAFTQIEPPTTQPVSTAQLFAEWLESSSRLLLISGAPGSGKSTAIGELLELAHACPEVPTPSIVDDFPNVNQSVRDISNLLHHVETSAPPGTKLVIATQVRANDSRTGITQQVKDYYPYYEPWVVALEPIPITEIEAIMSEKKQVQDSPGVAMLCKLDRGHHDTRFLRTPAALNILLSTPSSGTSSAPSLSGIVENVVSATLMKAEIHALNPVDHGDLLSLLCYHHFLGLSEDINAGRDIGAEVIPDRLVSLKWVQDRIAHASALYSSTKKGVPDAETVVRESPFLTLQPESRPGMAEEVARVTLPAALFYEHFVARGILNAIRRQEQVAITASSLRDLADGLVIVYMQAKITKEELTTLAAHCQEQALSEHSRLFYLYLLEDSPNFFPLLNKAPEQYRSWLLGYVDDAPNSYCWKMAAYQLLTLGLLGLDIFLAEMEKEIPDEVSSESAVQSLRGAVILTGSYEIGYVTRISIYVEVSRLCG